MGGVRKKVRHSSRWGKKAPFIQVSYFPYTKRRRKGRNKRFLESSPKQKKLNDKRSKRYFESLVRANFGKGDICIHPTYDDEHNPKDENEVKRKFQNFIARINYHRRKKGLPKAKWVAVTEIGKQSGRVHHHILMDGALDRDTVESLWRQGFCNADRLRPDKKHGLSAIICYLMKDPNGRRKWNSSHGNLVKPWTTVNDRPHAMSKKRLRSMAELPEDSEAMRQTIERDNPGYALLDVEKEFRDDTATWYFFARMKLKNPEDAGDAESG